MEYKVKVDVPLTDERRKEVLKLFDDLIKQPSELQKFFEKIKK